MCLKIINHSNTNYPLKLYIMRSINESMLTSIRQFLSGTGVAAFFKKEFWGAIGDIVSGCKFIRNWQIVLIEMLSIAIGDWQKNANFKQILLVTNSKGVSCLF